MSTFAWFMLAGSGLFFIEALEGQFEFRSKVLFIVTAFALLGLAWAGFAHD